MTSMRKMKNEDQPGLYEIALRAFDEDYQRYGQYPPLMDTVAKRFRPSIELGYTILHDDTIVGAVYFWQKGETATLGAIFIDPDYQNKGMGKEIMQRAEARLPDATKWTLDTPYEAFRNHHFYESLGYRKVGEVQPEKNDPFRLFLYWSAPGYCTRENVSFALYSRANQAVSGTNVCGAGGRPLRLECGRTSL